MSLTAHDALQAPGAQNTFSGLSWLTAPFCSVGTKAAPQTLFLHPKVRWAVRKAPRAGFILSFGFVCLTVFVQGLLSHR